MSLICAIDTIQTVCLGAPVIHLPVPSAFGVDDTDIAPYFH